MKQTAIAVLVAGAVLAGGAAPALAFHEEAGRVMGEMVDQFDRLWGLASQVGQHLRSHPPTIPWGPPPALAERPLVTFMLDHRDELALTPEQTTRLEALRNDFTRESIRREADIRVAEMDLGALLAEDRLDMAKVEAKVRELAKLRADLRIERLRTIEQGRAVLTPEQRTKLQGLLGGPARARRTAEQRIRM